MSDTDGAAGLRERIRTPDGNVWVAARAEVDGLPAWRDGFAGARKDHRYYSLVEETLRDGVEYSYFVVENDGGDVRAVQPFFLRDVDLVLGAGPRVRGVVAALRRVYPRALYVRALMVGCVAGEGHLAATGGDGAWLGRCLHDALRSYARIAGARLVVLKEFPSGYRDTLACFVQNGYTRIPSFPMARLNIEYASFDDVVAHVLSRATRKSLRRNLRKADAGEPISMEVVEDVGAVVDELYPLYLNVYDRARFRFEKLTPEYLVRLGERMPDRTRFFVWRQSGRPIAFSTCLVHGDTIYDEYIGLDYSVALDLHLYFYTLRDVIQWSIEHGYRWYCSTALNYDPKRRLRCQLLPLDLYVTHTSRLLNPVLRRLLPRLEPTRRDPALCSFPDYSTLWS